MPASWTVKATKPRDGGDLLGWNLESPQSSPEADVTSTSEVRFRGWFLAKGGPCRIILSQAGTVLFERLADLRRPDVVRAKVADPAARPGLECCGLDVTVPRQPGSYRLEVSTPDSPKGNGCDLVLDVLDAQGGPYALPGNNRLLFLGGDSNDSIGQFTENRSLSASSVASWEANFSAMKRWETELGLRMAFLVAPAKEEIFPEFFPFPRAARTVVDDFRRRFADRGVIVPIHELRAQRQFSYSETDTHWTDHGATIAAREVLKHWQMGDASLDALPQNFRVWQRHGDLGIKLEPRRASYELAFAQNPDRFLVFDNGVRNQGCLRLWQNPDAPVQGCCLIFGDSFGTNFAQSLTGVFAQVAYAYRPAGFDPVLAGLVQPSHVILQITQRFLHGSPERRGSVFDTAAAKITALPEAEREALTGRLRAQTVGPFGPLVAQHLDRL